MPDVAKPAETLSVIDAMAIVVGVVVGVGIFKTPSIVAKSRGVASLLGSSSSGTAAELAMPVINSEEAYP
jgi:APA family basic amino acid/polyamine antiporter